MSGSQLTTTNQDEQRVEDELFDSLTEVTRGSGIGFAALLLGKSASLGLHILIAQFLGVTGYGLFALGRAVMNLCQTFSKVGMDTGVVHFVSSSVEQEQHDRARRMFSTAFVQSCVSCTAGAVLLYIFAPTISSLLEEQQIETVLQYFALALAPYTLFQVMASLLMAHKRIALYQGLLRIMTPVLKLLLIGTALLLGAGIHGVILAFAVAGFLSVSVTIGVILNSYREYLVFTTNDLRFGTFLRYSTSVWLSNMSTMLFQRIDRLLIGFFYSASEVGIYNVGAVIGTNLLFFTKASSPIIKPVITRGHQRYVREQFADLYRTLMKWVFSATFFIVLPVLVFPDLILSLFGPDFQQARMILIIFTAYALVYNLFGQTITNLKLTGHQDLELLNSVSALVGIVFLDLILIPPFGGVGAALGTLLAVGIMELVRSFEISYVQEFHPFTLEYAKLTAILFLIGTITYFVSLRVHLLKIAVLLLGTGLSGLAFYRYASDHDVRICKRGVAWLKDHVTS